MGESRFKRIFRRDIYFSITGTREPHNSCRFQILKIFLCRDEALQTSKAHPFPVIRRVNTLAIG